MDAGNRPTAAVLTLLLLLFHSHCCHTALGYGMANRTVDEYGRLQSLWFLHIPKTGTSFIIAMRNYLTACETKDKICSGQHGGSEKSFRFPMGTTFSEMSCDYHLEACDPTKYHRPYRAPRPDWQPNYITLLRHPVEQARSGFFYTNDERKRVGLPPLTLTQFMVQFGNIHVKVGFAGVLLVLLVD
jgi:hypothetical protein